MPYKQYYDPKLIYEIDRLFAAKRIDDAGRKIMYYKHVYPNDNLIYLYDALYFSLKGNRDVALELARNTINKKFGGDNNRITAYTLYADIMYDNEIIDEAIVYYKKAIELSIEDRTVAKARIKLINLYMSKFEYDKALELCVGHENLNNILVKEANIYLAKKQYDKAIESLDKIKMDVLKNDFRNNLTGNQYVNQNIYYSYGDAYYHLGDYNKAKINLYKALLPRDSTLVPKVLVDLGYIALNKGEYEDAFDYANRIINESKNPYYGYELLASIYMELKDYESAEKAMSNIRNAYKFFQKQSEFHYIKGDYKEAEKNICKVLSDDLEQEHPTTLTNYALILLRLGKINTLRSLYNYIICESNIHNETLDYIKEYIDSNNENDLDDNHLNYIKTRN